MLSYLLLTIQMSIFAIMISGDTLKPYISFIIPTSVINSIQENKLYSGLGAFLGGNILSSIISQTGAFEIFCNGVNVWSKFKTGNVPTAEQLISILRHQGVSIK